MLGRVMMIAGEASGDLHGSGVVRELKNRLPAIDVFGVGGDRMEAEGMELVHHISRLSFMGFMEVLKNLPTINELGRKLEALLDARRPDVVVLIDYPGFNLRFAKKAKQRNIKVLYYISPQVWAWHKGRVKKMRSLVDRMKVVFPFEVEIYKNEGIDVEFVGHPLAERIGSQVSRDEFFSENGFDREKKLLALLPGSRKQEIDNIFPVMLETAARLKQELDIQVAVGVAPNLGRNFLRGFMADSDSVTLVEHATYDVMAHADAAIVTSGTATLETGWFGTPMAVVYKTSPVTYTIGRALVGVPYIGLVNIVAGEKIVPEFVQNDMNMQNITHEMKRQLTDVAYAGDLRSRLSVIKTRLGEVGASAKVAEGIIELGE
ncbi:MAG: lipid-A-disaccharide synthase [Bacteroidetes bacterium]|nr:lipid-A-disaccharide synthase [Bacteroidota bacterium]MCW5895411.1 lipid-A-disaccharide synthase [Bacteroidota bacterium]